MHCLALLGLALALLGILTAVASAGSNSSVLGGLRFFALFALASIMAGSSSSDLAGLLNEMLSLQERLKKHGVSFGAGLPGPPADRPEPPAEEARVSTEAVASISVGLQDRADLFPTFWGEPVSAFHGRMGFSANQWLHHFESLSLADQPPELRDGAYWVRKFPLNASGGVALSELVGDWESVQVLRFISAADPDPRSSAAGAASTTAPASSTTTSAPVDASVEDFPEPVQSLVWRCRGLCVDCIKSLLREERRGLRQGQMAPQPPLQLLLDSVEGRAPIMLWGGAAWLLSGSVPLLLLDACFSGLPQAA